MYQVRDRIERSFVLGGKTDINIVANLLLAIAEEREYKNPV
jgi:hypothetical protein